MLKFANRADVAREQLFPQAHLTREYFAALDTYGVACFVRDPASMLMWSYYADSHRGIAVRFDTNAFLQKFEHACIPLEVKYQRDFPEDLSFYSDGRFGFVQKTLGTKAEAWKREEEWRLVLVGRSGYVRMPAGMIDGIVLGLRTPPEIEQSIRSWVEGRAQIKLSLSSRPVASMCPGQAGDHSSAD